MEAMQNILTRNSPRELIEPIPSNKEMQEIYQAALRAPDHAWLRPSRFIEVTGKGLEKLSKIFVELLLPYLPQHDFHVDVLLSIF